MFIIGENDKLLIYRQWERDTILKNAILKKSSQKDGQDLLKYIPLIYIGSISFYIIKKENILELIYGYVLKRKKSNNCLKNKCLVRDADTPFYYMIPNANI